MALNLTRDQAALRRDFGESVIVRPIDDLAREVTGVVHRAQPDETGDGGARIASYKIELDNSATTGMTPQEALQRQAGGVPSLSFNRDYGDVEAITKPINRVLKQNQGKVLLEVLI